MPERHEDIERTQHEKTTLHLFVNKLKARIRAKAQARNPNSGHIEDYAIHHALMTLADEMDNVWTDLMFNRHPNEYW